MNRLSILVCIRKHLEADRVAPTGSRPLGEIVLEVGREIRGNGREETAGSSRAVGFTAIQLVAAFVDGSLTPDEESVVCAAVAYDNSVLAEIVASVRVELEKEMLPELPSELIDRLAGVATDCPAVPNPSRLESPVRSRRNPSLVMAGSLAAVLLVACFVWFYSSRVTRDRSTESIAQVPRGAQSINQQPETESEAGEGQAAERNNSPLPPVAQLDPPKEKTVDADSADLGSESASDLASNHSVESSPQTNVSEGDSVEIPAELAKSMGALRWTRIQGILARSQGHSSTSGSSTDSRWEGTEQGASIAQAEFETQSIFLSTLPFSRAEAEFSNGGRLVIAPDSCLSISQNEMGADQLHLERGELALVEMPPGTAIEVLLEDHPLALLKWQSRGTVVMSSSATGILAQVDGTVDCSGTNFEDSMLRLGQEIERLGPKSRNPAWVNRSIETPNIPKTILAQLSTSKDLVGTFQELSQQQYALADSSAWGKFSGWAALSSRRQLEHVFAQGNFLQRSIAIDRLLNMPAWSATSRKLWQSLAMTSQSPEQIRVMASLTEQLRRNRPFVTGQIEQLLKSLESQDPATRSVADALLRRNYGSGPNYNPILPQANTPRAILIWRRFVSAR